MEFSYFDIKKGFLTPDTFSILHLLTFSESLQRRACLGLQEDSAPILPR